MGSGSMKQYELILYVERWNGASLLLTHVHRQPESMITSDASGSWGCGAIWNQRWFQCRWSDNWANTNIACKEFVPIILGLELWGQALATKHVRIQCDNLAVVAILNSRKCKDSLLAHLLRCCHFVCAIYDITDSVEHIEGRLNVAADALSRNNLDLFFLSAPQADPHPSVISEEIKG